MRPDGAHRARTGVVLHGYGGDSSEVRALAEALGDRLGARVLTPDLPGHGSARATPLTLAAAREAVAALAAEANTPLDFAVGHSLGARLALELDAAAYVLIAMPGAPVFGGSSRDLVRTLRPQRVTEAAPLSGLVEILSAPIEIPNRDTLLLTPSEEIPTGIALAEQWTERGVECQRIADTSHRDIAASNTAIDTVASWLEERLS